jgi:hypothetical protein
MNVEYNNNGPKQFVLGTDASGGTHYTQLVTYNISSAYDTDPSNITSTGAVIFSTTTGYAAVSTQFSPTGDTVFFLGKDGDNAIITSYALSSNYDLSGITDANDDVQTVAAYSGTSRTVNLSALSTTGPSFSGVGTGNTETNLAKYDFSIESDGKTIYVLDGNNRNAIKHTSLT